MEEKEIKQFFLQIKTKADSLMNYFLIGFFVVGLLLSFYYDTWMIGVGVGGLLLIAYYLSKALSSGSTVYQYVLSAVFGIFMAQYIYQMHGMFEMHFFAFIGSAILIIYRNWKLQIPLAVIVLIHLVVFGYLQFNGFDKIYFTQLEHLPFNTFIIHVVLAMIIFSLCGLWSYKFEASANNHIEQSFKIGQLQQAEDQKELLVAMSNSLKASNERLKKAHDEFQTLFENIEEVFFSFKVDFIIDDARFKTLQISPACATVYGYAPEEFYTNPMLWREVIVKEDRHIVEKNLKLLSKGKSVTQIHRIIHRDQSIRWIQTKIKPTLNEKRALVRLDGITSDITEMKLAEENLKRSEADLIENLGKIQVNEKLMKEAEKLAQVGSWQGDIITGVAKWSEEAFRLFGYEPGKVDPTFELFLKNVHPEDHDHVLFLLNEAVKHHDFQKLEFRMMDPARGEVKYLHAALIIERDANRIVKNVLGFCQDITERKKLEKQLMDEQHKKQHQITQAVIAAQEKERLFLGEELHDNINPTLATVKLYLDCIIREENINRELLTDSKAFVTMAMDEIRALSKSLVPPALKEVGLRDAIEDMMENIKKVNDSSIVFDWLIQDEISEKLSLTIFRIIQEQVNNIFKHANASMINIKLQQCSEKIYLSVKDNGVGFDTSKKRTGVGFQNIASRADLFNGKMIINSEAGSGCELLIDFKLEPPIPHSDKEAISYRSLY